MAETWTVDGKTSIVTGSNTGLGRVTAVELARRGSHVILASRSEERTTPIVEEIGRQVGHDRVEFLALDLSSLASVKSAADTFLADGRPLHLLVNNAGLAGRRGMTADGFELTFGVNYLGHYLLTRLLMNRMVASAPARIVHVASSVHHRARHIDWERLRKPRLVPGRSEYAVSKLANILFNRELARRLTGTGVTTYAAHPGLAATDIYRVVPPPIRRLVTRSMPTPENAARTQVWCATAPELWEESGRYYADRRQKDPSPAALDTGLAAELWTRSEAWVGDFL
ncbi:MAG: SDR family oxidoreductase [Acidimicrobiia bacterium]|nr:SDR family oxidoreductase [Acidimicrobiia bacterium]